MVVLAGWLFLVALSVPHTLAAGIPGSYLADLVAEYENEILGRSNIVARHEKEDVTQLIGEVGHPVEITSWDTNLNLGQVAGVAVDKDNDPVVFHRGDVVWDANSFALDNTLKKRTLIQNKTILKIDQDTGLVSSGLGEGLFYMPHGIQVDHENNIWVTDVGLHQVMMIPEGSNKPSLILGEAFVPGSDKTHFCKPTATAVSRNGILFVADGYCNKRVVVFDTKGRYISEIKGDWNIVHSLALFEDQDILCVADREGQGVACVGAGLSHPQFRGSPVLQMDNVGRVFGLAGRGSALVAVIGAPNPRGVTLDMEMEGRVVDAWAQGPKGLKNPHQMAMSRNGDTIYVSEIGPNRIRKLMVVAPQDNIFNE